MGPKPPGGGNPPARGRVRGTHARAGAGDPSAGGNRIRTVGPALSDRAVRTLVSHIHRTTAFIGRQSALPRSAPDLNCAFWDVEDERYRSYVKFRARFKPVHKNEGNGLWLPKQKNCMR
jgi:hypothetical protein